MKKRHGFSRIAEASFAQIVASIFSFLLTAGAASGLGAAEFGVFSVAFSVYSLVQGSYKGFLTEPVIYSQSTTTSAQSKEAVRRSTTLVAVYAAPWTILGSVLLLSPLPNWLCLLMMFTPVFVLLQHCRFMAQLVQRERLAILADCVALIALAVMLLVGGRRDIEDLVWAWGLSASLGLAVALVGVRAGISLRGSRTWYRQNTNGALYYFTDFWASNSLIHGSVLIVSLLGTPAMAGSIRAAQILLTPVLLVTRGIMSAMGPMMNRMFHGGRKSLLPRVGITYSSLTALAGLLTGVCVWLLQPSGLIEVVLGDSTAGALSVLPISLVALIAGGAASGAALILRAHGLVARTFKYKISILPVGLLLVILGVHVGGAPGSQWGLLTSESVRAILSWRDIRRIE